MGPRPYELAGSTRPYRVEPAMGEIARWAFFVMRLRFGITANTKRSTPNCIPRGLSVK